MTNIQRRLHSSFHRVKSIRNLFLLSFHQSNSIRTTNHQVLLSFHDHGEGALPCGCHYKLTEAFVVWVIVYDRIPGKNVLRLEFCCYSWDRFSIQVWFAVMTRRNCSMLKLWGLACYNLGTLSIAQTEEGESEPMLQRSIRSLRSDRKTSFHFSLLVFLRFICCSTASAQKTKGCQGET